MTAETLNMLSYIFFGLCICCFIAGLILFFVLDIKGTINELSGRAEKKFVEGIRKKNTSGAADHTQELDNMTDISAEAGNTAQIGGETEVLDVNKTQLLSENSASETNTSRLDCVFDNDSCNISDICVMDIDIIITQGESI